MRGEFVKTQPEGYQYLDEACQQALNAMNEGSVARILKAGVDKLVEDVRAMPKPRSNISRGGYTHLLDAVKGFELDGGEGYAAGWGKYYGPIVEKGHASPKGRWVASRAHLRPTYKQNMQKYQKAMQEEFNKMLEE